VTQVENFANTTQALEQVSGACARLIEALRVSSAPPEVLSGVEAHIGQALALLQGHVRPGPHSQSSLTSHPEYQVANPGFDPQGLMPFSPIIGRRNPVSPRFEFHPVGNRLEGRGVFPVCYVGAPQTAHGGLVAAVLDELMGLVNYHNGEGAFTGTMTVRYHRPTPIERELTLSAEMLESDGRKVHSRAEIRCDGELTASAEGLFIKPR
jgi:hypothetical protein